MPNIYRIVSNYSGAFAAINTAPAEVPLPFRKADLCRSMITVGNPSFISWKSIRRDGLARALYDSIFEKAALVMKNIESTHAAVRRHSIFDTYVTDQKRIVSYNLGMAFAKLYAEKLLGIPNLIHVEFLKKNNAVGFAPQPGTKKPKEADLVGQTSDGNWHVVEAKGISTSESHLSAKIAEAKEQVGQIATIHGVAPLTGTACATYLGDDRIFTRIEDPPSIDGSRIEVDKTRFYEAYYAPFLQAKKLQSRNPRKLSIDGLDFELFSFKRGSIELEIGLEAEISDLVQTKKYEISKNIDERIQSYALDEAFGGQYSIGLDGFVVRYRR